MSDLDRFRAEQMKDPEFREYYMEMQPAADISKAIIAYRAKHGLTQQELASAVGIDRADLARLESCDGNPTLKTLRRLARGMNMRLKIEFLPVDSADPQF